MPTGAAPAPCACGPAFPQPGGGGRSPVPEARLLSTRRSCHACTGSANAARLADFIDAAMNRAQNLPETPRPAPPVPGGLRPVSAGGTLRWIG